MTACTPPPGPPVPDRPPRVTLVGVNGHGRSHLRTLLALHAAGRVRLHQLVDPVPLPPEAARAEVALVESACAAGARARPDEADGGEDAALLDVLTAAPVLPDLDAALAAAETPDVVVLCTPIHTHATLAAQALRAGCDVLLEKPPTASLAELEELLAVEAASPGCVQVGFQTFGSSALPELRRIVAEHEIGDLVGVGGVGTWVRGTAYWTRSAWTGRRAIGDRPVVDGVTTNPLAHAVALALHAAGARTAEDVASVQLDQYRCHDIEVDDTTAVRVTTTAGLPVSLGLTLCSDEHRRPWVTLQGTAGRARYDYYDDSVEIEVDGGSRTFHAERVGLLENLLEHRETGAPLLCPLRETGAFMRVLEAVRTADDPTRVPAGVAVAREVQEAGGIATTLVLPDVLHWCERVADEHATFRELGAPWATPTAAGGGAG